MMTDKKGLYVHIPFCRSKCPYCDFYSFIPDEKTMDTYIDSLVEKIKTKSVFELVGLDKNQVFDTVYIGGGTPSVLGSRRMSKLLDAIFTYLNVDKSAEITVECNPSQADDDFFDSVSDGVNRISFGVQSAVDSERKKLGRRSSKSDIERVIEKSREKNIDNISLDLMLAVPDQTIKSLDESLDFLISAGVNHISCYILTIEEHTFFYRNIDKLNLPDEDEQCEMYLHTCQRLEEVGLSQYEISNFARKGYESKHNLKYWNCDEYLGLGPAAHSFINGKRYFFERDIQKFIDEKIVFDDSGGDEQEYIMLRLRLKDGLRFDEYFSRYNESLPANVLSVMRGIASRNLAVMTSDGFHLTREGFLVSNDLISDILCEL